MLVSLNSGVDGTFLARSFCVSIFVFGRLTLVGRLASDKLVTCWCCWGGCQACVAVVDGGVSIEALKGHGSTKEGEGRARLLSSIAEIMPELSKKVRIKPHLSCISQGGVSQWMLFHALFPLNLDYISQGLLRLLVNVDSNVNEIWVKYGPNMPIVKLPNGNHPFYFYQLHSQTIPIQIFPAHGLPAFSIKLFTLNLGITVSIAAVLTLGVGAALSKYVLISSPGGHNEAEKVSNIESL